MVPRPDPDRRPTEGRPTPDRIASPPDRIVSFVSLPSHVRALGAPTPSCSTIQHPFRGKKAASSPLLALSGEGFDLSRVELKGHADTMTRRCDAPKDSEGLNPPPITVTIGTQRSAAVSIGTPRSAAGA